MSIRTYLTETLQVSHLFMCDDATRDPNSKGITTTATATNGAFVADPVCEGVVNSWETNSGGAGGSTGLIIGNTSDINVGNNIWSEYSIFLWFKATEPIDTPTTIYEQGGGTNNQAINLGIARAITSQAADAGQTFLIAQSKFQAEEGRAYFVAHSWQHNSVLSGSLNKISLIINGVIQESVEGATAVFPNHTGDATLGNANDALQSYNGSTQNFASRSKKCNMLGLIADSAINETEAREIFERTVIPDVIIAADTISAQQAALDSLSGSAYQGSNCAIRIIESTESSNYRLFLDNITFVQDSNLRDISVQFLGQGTLTIENANGSNAFEVSTPEEVDLDGTTILQGGGSLSIVDDVIRIKTAGVISGIAAEKLVLEEAGSYTLVNCDFNIIEEFSLGSVSVLEDSSTHNSVIGSISFGSKAAFSGLPADSDYVIIVIEELDSGFNSLPTPIFIDLTLNLGETSIEADLVSGVNYRWKADAMAYDRSNEDSWVNFTAEGVVNIGVSLSKITDNSGSQVYGNGVQARKDLINFNPLTMQAQITYDSQNPIISYFDVFDKLEEILTSHDAIKAGLRRASFNHSSKEIIFPDDTTVKISDVASNLGRVQMEAVIKTASGTPFDMLATPFNSAYGIYMVETVIKPEVTGLLESSDPRLDNLDAPLSEILEDTANIDGDMQESLIMVKRINDNTAPLTQ